MSVVGFTRVSRGVVVVVAVAVALVVGWWTAQARAGHDPDATVHVCAAANGALRLAEDCRRNQTPLVLATEAGLHAIQTDTSVQAAQERIAELEAATAALAERVAQLEASETKDRAAPGSPQRETTPSGTTAEDPCDEGGPCEPSALEQRVEALEGIVAGHATTIAGLHDGLDGLHTLLAGVTRGPDAHGRDTLRVSGVNLQVVNGTDSTDGDPNGLGNVIIGYNTPRGDTTAGDRAGSHALVVGDQHHWTAFGHLLAGWHNTATGPWASVTGGSGNTASGDRASVSGGQHNTAGGLLTSVSGGQFNVASGDRAVVSGGHSNLASGDRASVSGGINNAASGTWTSVSGGLDNSAIGGAASVSGGQLNTASGSLASVSGGWGNTASGNAASILGGIQNTVGDFSACHPTC